MENRISIALKLMGFLSLLGAIAVGFNSYEMPIEGYQYTTDKDYVTLFTWIGSGVISLVLFLAFAEVISLLEANKNNTNKLIDLIEKTSNRRTSDEKYSGKEKSIRNKEKIKDEATDILTSSKEINEMRKELKSRGYGNDLVESIIAEKINK